ncbi:hypothetical protein [Chishuiella sp.]|uniref:hypothetical protein n=1 Tax=Chishuiella sp. TaxID=1969467 RepID=UPI0028A853A3|nr:hypothetical protein [Chishuiella sp.]
MKKLYLIIFFIFNNYILLWGQSDKKDDPSKYIPNILPTTPESFKFSNFGNIPIGMFTGAPNISIPITEFSSNNIKIPIKLNYSSNGINIDQMNGSVGLGWTFITGGLITRTVRDKKDVYNKYTGIDVPEYNGNFSILTEYLKLCENDDFDSEPDLYTANFLGHNFNFVINQKGNIIILEQKNYIVNYNNESFEIILDDGTRFSFSATETVLNRQQGSGHSIPTTSVNSWYLTSITDTNNNIITIEYNDVIYTTTLSQSQTMTFTTGEQLKYNDACFTVPYYWPIGQFGSLMSSIQTVKGKQISKISDSYNNKIIFSYQNYNDQDYQKLVNIKKIDKSNNIIEEFKFNYKLTNNNRLFLTEIYNVKNNNFYKFTYYNPDSLPERLSFSRDMWGYFNNNKNNSLIPKINDINDIAPSFADTKLQTLPNYNGADQSVNPNVGYYGLLKMITYPTGGNTLFNYENHKIKGTKKKLPKILL